MQRERIQICRRSASDFNTISLLTWLSDFIYIPCVSKNRKKKSQKKRSKYHCVSKPVCTLCFAIRSCLCLTDGSLSSLQHGGAFLVVRPSCLKRSSRPTSKAGLTGMARWILEMCFMCQPINIQTNTDIFLEVENGDEVATGIEYFGKLTKRHIK
jgi:hypothetical protein